MQQATLDKEHQALVREIAAAQYLDDARRHELPMLLILKAGIHPYNRASGYYHPDNNLILGYQCYGECDDEASIRAFIQHEVAHWHQWHVQGYRDTGSSMNVHRTKSWQEACFIATCNLWPELGLTRDAFRPGISKRIDGKVRSGFLRAEKQERSTTNRAKKGNTEDIHGK